MVVTLLMLTLMPHHHHLDGAVCWVNEVCQHDGNVNDAHTQHAQNADAHLCFYFAHKTKILKAQTFFGNDTKTPSFLYNYGLFAATFFFLFGKRNNKKQYVASVFLLVCLCCKQVLRRGPPCR